MTHSYTVILEPEENGGYSVHCAAIPGCSSQGETVDDALHNIREAMTGIMKVRQQAGLPLPEETPEIIVEEIREILAGRAEDGLPLTVETRVVELPAEVAV